MSKIKQTIYFLLEDIMAFHEEMENLFVMEPGIHDKGLLESAVNAPFQTFDGHDLYPSPLEKAARLCYGLAKDHPFRDGNKRTAVHSMLVYLFVNDIDIKYTNNELEDTIIAIADGTMDYQDLVNWLKARKK